MFDLAYSIYVCVRAVKWEINEVNPIILNRICALIYRIGNYKTDNINYWVYNSAEIEQYINLYKKKRNNNRWAFGSNCIHNKYTYTDSFNYDLNRLNNSERRKII
jgi:hypothetical protein